MVNILRVDGAQLEGIHYLRAFGNADSIRDDVAGAEHVVCVGGSYIGAEVAASLTEMGKRCTIVEIEDVILSRAFGEEVGRRLPRRCSPTTASRFATARRVAAFEGDERVATVLTESGLEIDCDAVVVGAGVRPDTMLAARAGARGRGRHRLRLRPRDLGRRHLRRRRLLQLRERDPRPPASASSTGTSRSTRAATPPAGCSATSALPRRPLLLQRPLRLGFDRVPRRRRRLGRGHLAGRSRRRRLLGLVSELRPSRRRPLGRPIRGPARGPAPDRVGRAGRRRPRCDRRPGRRPRRTRLANLRRTHCGLV